MISKYLILMSMTCVENAGNDPTSLAEVPLTHPDSLDYDHIIDYSLSGYSKIFTSRRSLPSLLHVAEVVRVFGCVVSIPLQTLFFLNGTLGKVNVWLFFPHREIYTIISHSSQPW
jgi:hypothetical protein